MPAAVEFENVSLAFDDHVVLKDLSFSIAEGSMRILLGASGAGKSLVLKLILGLVRPDAGTILVNGQRVDNMPEAELLKMRSDIGMVFQENALFDSLTVAENVGYRLYEETDMAMDAIRARIEEVLAFLGLGDFIDRMPATLSGGQRRRVGIARAMASKPSLMLFDDSTTGLDPVIAASVDDEIVKLRDLEKVTSIVVTQQIELNGPVGRMIAAVMLGLAEIELEFRRERQAAGIEVAKKNGAFRGRAKGTTKGKPQRARQLRKQGLTAAEIANAMNTSERTVWRYLGKATA